jgi:hypothetical protein
MNSKVVKETLCREDTNKFLAILNDLEKFPSAIHFIEPVDYIGKDKSNFRVGIDRLSQDNQNPHGHDNNKSQVEQ